MVLEGKPVVDVDAKIAGRGCCGVDFHDTLYFEYDGICVGLVMRNTIPRKVRLSGVSPVFEVSTATVDVLFDFLPNILYFGWCICVCSWGLSTSLPSRQGVGLSREHNRSLFHD